jgi:hypothetical protein
LVRTRARRTLEVIALTRGIDVPLVGFDDGDQCYRL